MSQDLFDRHRERLEAVRRACRSRDYYSPFPETPQKYPDAQQAEARGRQAFERQLGRGFELELPGILEHLGSEVSPYTGERLGITYPRADPDALFAAARAALPALRDAGAEARVGVCLEIVAALFGRLFELTFAGMHTTGQSFAMSYAGSGTNALDRGLEAIACAYEAMSAIPQQARWERQFGSARIRLEKRYRLVPRGVAVCFACASFPTWNALPSLFASLATGNPVIVKPHPTAVLPVALIVRTCREVLARAGLPRDAVLLALDAPGAPIGKRLVEHPATAIVDFTGSAQFGAWVEAHGPRGLTFTETAGVNTVVIDSCEDLEALARSLGTTLSLFSAQMCTSPQNVFVPRGGIRAGGRHVPYEEVVAALTAAVGAVAGDARRAGSVLAAIQSPATLGLIEAMRSEGERAGRVLRDSAPYAHPEFPRARTATPLMLEVAPEHTELYRTERFGPISFVIPVADAAEGLARAARDVAEVGGLTAFAYSSDPRFLAQAEQAYAQAGAQLTCNLTGPMPLNFAAAYSDFHVTGLNPAGNACLTDAAFVAGRFRIAQARQPAAEVGQVESRNR